MDRKIIFLDIDGTLTEPGSNIPPESALKAIRGAQEKGNYVFLCTGRNYDMLRPLLVYGFDGVVSASGGYITFGDEVVYDCPMTDEQKIKAFDVLKKNGIYRTVECNEGAFTDEGFKEFLEEHASEGGNSELLRWRKQIETSLNIRPMAEYAGQDCYKIVCMTTDEKAFEEPMAVLGEEFLFCIQEKDKFGIVNGEMISRNFDKGQAVERVCRYLNIPVENSYGYGDSMNDREMLMVAGKSICMANGAESMKALADEVCPAVTEDGLYHSFMKLGLM